VCKTTHRDSAILHGRSGEATKTAHDKNVHVQAANHYCISNQRQPEGHNTQGQRIVHGRRGEAAETERHVQR
jgi:hypothetical protein